GGQPQVDDDGQLRVRRHRAEEQRRGRHEAAEEQHHQVQPVAELLHEGVPDDGPDGGERVHAKAGLRPELGSAETGSTKIFSRRPGSFSHSARETSRAIFPRTRMPTRWQSFSTSEMLWEEKRIVLPPAFSPAIMSRISFRPKGSSPVTGS